MGAHIIKNYQYLFQNNLLRNKVAFITGGATGIGFTIAEVLLRHQCNVVIASRKLENLNVASSALSEISNFGRCLIVQADVRKPEEIVKAIDKTLNEFGRVDILVNNAAGNFLASAASLSFNAFKTVIDIDTVGTFNCSKVAYDKWFKDHGGVIVNISANLSKVGAIFQVHAGAAKAAVDAMTIQLAVEWGRKNIRVVGVAPGPIEDTEGTRRLSAGLTSKDIAEKIPIGRMGNRLDIANAVLFLVSDAAAYITGETVIVDGASRFASVWVDRASKL